MIDMAKLVFPCSTLLRPIEGNTILSIGVHAEKAGHCLLHLYTSYVLIGPDFPGHPPERTRNCRDCRKVRITNLSNLAAVIIFLLFCGLRRKFLVKYPHYIICQENQGHHAGRDEGPGPYPEPVGGIFPYLKV